MLFNVRGAMWVLAAIAVVILICVIDLSCSGGNEGNQTYVRVKDELEAGRKEMDYQRAEDLARKARGLRRLAEKYREAGQDDEAGKAIAEADAIDLELAKFYGE